MFLKTFDSKIVRRDFYVKIILLTSADMAPNNIQYKSAQVFLQSTIL